MRDWEFGLGPSFEARLKETRRKSYRLGLQVAVIGSLAIFFLALFYSSQAVVAGLLLGCAIAYTLSPMRPYFLQGLAVISLAVISGILASSLLRGVCLFTVTIKVCQGNAPEAFIFFMFAFPMITAVFSWIGGWCIRPKNG